MIGPMSDLAHSTSNMIDAPEKRATHQAGVGYLFDWCQARDSLHTIK
jgi:hypothetical protein